MSKYLQTDQFYGTKPLHPCDTLAALPEQIMSTQESAELPPDVLENVFDLPFTLLKRYILTALHAPYDSAIHSSASTGADYFVWLRAARPAEYVKMLQKFLPQTQIDVQATVPIRYSLNVPVKTLDEDPAVPAVSIENNIGNRRSAIREPDPTKG